MEVLNSRGGSLVNCYKPKEGGRRVERRKKRDLKNTIKSNFSYKDMMLTENQHAI